jgi:hypothetical protein
MFKGYYTVRRAYPAMCKQCTGSGFQATKHGPISCTAPDCTAGDVERWIIEVVHDDEPPAPSLHAAR